MSAKPHPPSPFQDTQKVKKIYDTPRRFHKEAIECHALQILSLKDCLIKKSKFSSIFQKLYQN